MTGTGRVRAYYESLNSGDAAAVSAHFTDSAVHYYTRLGPHEGAGTIGGYAALGVSTIDAQWYVENAIEQGDQVVIEWTMTWRDGKIAEVRAYHHGGKKNPQGDLLGFDHKGRGYTMLEDWKAPAKDEEDQA